MNYRFKTWHAEQGVLLVLVTAATIAQLRTLPCPSALSFLFGADLRASTWVSWAETMRATWPILLASMTTIVAQKVRSIADRQEEANRRAIVHQAIIDCAIAQKRWGFVIQALGLFTSITLAPTVWSMPVALYTALYSTAWRPWWRRWRESRREVIGTCAGCRKPVHADCGAIVFLPGDEIAHFGCEGLR